MIKTSTKNNKQPFTDLEIKKIDELVAKGLKWGTISRTLRISHYLLCKYYRKMEMDKRPRNKDFVRKNEYSIVQQNNGTLSAISETALYDPIRDGIHKHTDLTAILMGDPPPQRRALLQSQFTKEYKEEESKVGESSHG
jgi:hypothetical protein